MTIFKTILLYFNLFIAFSQCYSQTLKFENYSTKNGLPSDEVYNMHQDKSGYLWFFTNYGAVKYNGKEFKSILKNLPFNDSFIYSIFERNDGRKWIANSNAKIFEVVNDSAVQVKGTEAVSEKLRKSAHEIIQLYVDDDANIYTITKSTSYKFQYDSGKYIAIDLSVQMKDSVFLFKLIEVNKTILPIITITNSGLYNLTNRIDSLDFQLTDNKKLYSYKIPSKSPSFPRYFKRYDSLIYFAFYKKLYKIDAKKRISSIPIGNYVNNFIIDKNKHVWVACFNNGLFELDERDSIINHYFDGITVNDVLLDAENGLWLTTTNSGVYYCSDTKALHFENNSSLGRRINFIKAINDVLFIAVSNGELFTLNNSKFKSSYKSDIVNSTNDIIKYNTNYLLVSRYKIEIVNINSQGNISLVKTVSGVESALNAIYLGNEEVLYSNRRGIGIARKGRLNSLLYVDRKIYTLASANGNYYLGTDNGVFLFKKDDFSEFFKVNNIPTVKVENLNTKSFIPETKETVITKIILDNKSNLWLCSIGSGVFKLDSQNKLKKINTSNGLPSNIVKDIFFTHDNRVLISTNRGLFSAKLNNRQSIENVEWNAIYNDAVEECVLFKNSLYLSTKEGLVIMDDSKIQEKERIFFNLHSIIINSQKVSLNELSHLSAFQNNLEFEFDLVSFKKSNLKISYKLNGPIEYNGSVVDEHLKLNNLPFGDYKLILFPEIDKGQKIEVKFKIPPKFWQTKPFIVSLLLFIILVILAILRLIVFSIRKKDQKKTERQMILTEYRLLALRAQMDPHFIFNSLNSIQQFIMTGDNAKAEIYLSKFAKLIRELLESNANQSVLLSEEVEILKGYIEMEMLRFDNSFSYSIRVDDKLNPSQIKLPHLIIQPFVENAIWHGLLTKQGNRTINVKLEYESNVTIKCSIDDNGIGREASRKHENKFKRKSLAINIVRERLNLMAQSLKVDCGVVITDKTNQQGEASGTRIDIVLPILN